MATRIPSGSPALNPIADHIAEFFDVRRYRNIKSGGASSRTPSRPAASFKYKVALEMPAALTRFVFVVRDKLPTSDRHYVQRSRRLQRHKYRSYFGIQLL